jgi:hypothetical protein
MNCYRLLTPRPGESVSSYRPSEIESFQELTLSLQKWRRAEVLDEDNTNVAPLLYEDPLPDSQLLKRFLRANTTIVVGRKGTGKSTLIQKAEAELRESDRVASIYIDVKTLHTGTTAATEAPYPTKNERDYARKIIWFQAFLSEFAAKLRDAISGRDAGRTFFGPKSIPPSVTAAIEHLSDIRNYLRDVEVSGHSVGSTGQTDERYKQAENRAGLGVGALGPQLEFGAGAQSGQRSGHQINHYDKKYAKYFDIPAFIRDTRSVLSSVRIKYVYVFLDDFSELPRESMRALMDDVVSPLETASEEIFKFKIAAYPGRFYLGALDRNKIDVIDLDIAKLHFSRTAEEMNAAAVDFVSRMLTKRCRFYAAQKLDFFFEGNLSAICELLYEVSYSNPRTIGWVLDYASRETIARGEPIDANAIKQASKQYYEEVLLSRLHDSAEVEMAGQQRAAILLAKELLNCIVQRSRDLRNLIDEDLKFSHQSHFHVYQDKVDVLLVLEEYQLVNRYRNARNKDGDLVEIFSLDHGGCVANQIRFGRGPDKNYLVRRAFNYTAPLTEISTRLEYFQCDGCSCQLPISEEPMFKRYDFACPECRVGRLKKMRREHAPAVVIPLAAPSPVLKAANVRVSKQEHELLTIINARAETGIFAKDIAALLDVPSHTAAAMAKRLAEIGYVVRAKTPRGYRYTLSPSATDTFFSARSGQMTLPPPPAQISAHR